MPGSGSLRHHDRQRHVSSWPGESKRPRSPHRLRRARSSAVAMRSPACATALGQCVPCASRGDSCALPQASTHVHSTPAGISRCGNWVWASPARISGYSPPQAPRPQTNNLHPRNSLLDGIASPSPSRSAARIHGRCFGAISKEKSRARKCSQGRVQSVTFVVAFLVALVPVATGTRGMPPSEELANTESAGASTGLCSLSGTAAFVHRQIGTEVSKRSHNRPPHSGRKTARNRSFSSTTDVTGVSS